MLRQRSPFGLAAGILVAVLAVSGVATAGEVDGVHNGTFELGRSPDGTRPAQWYVGFPGEGLAAPGAWTLLDDDGGAALQIRSDSDDGYYLSQIVDLPAGAMAGVTVTVGAMARVADGDGWAVVQLVALNPEAPVDPDTGIAEVGHVVVGTSSGSWERIQGSVTLSGPAELLALAAVIRPRIVSVGIETDFFWQAHRDQWPAFRTMVCTARERLRALDPEVHVTTYFTLPALVRPDGSPDAEGQAALRELKPCIDSVGFSTYPADGVHHLDALPAGFFAAAADVDPALPLIVPECGFPTGGIYSEAEQAEFLRRLLDELAGHPTLAVVWYSLYDQTYLGVAPWFQDAFRTIGLHQLDWTPKAAAALMRRLHTLRSLRHPAGRVGPVHMRIDGRHLQPPGG